MKKRQKLAVEALFMLKKRRKEHEDDDDEACGRMLAVVCKMLCTNTLAIYLLLLRFSHFSHLVI